MVKTHYKVNKNLNMRDLEDKYRVKKKILYAVLAIGKDTNNPPQWALDACKDYYNNASKSHFDFARKRNLYFYKGMEESDYLEKMAEYFALNKDKSLTIRAAAIKVLGSKDNNALIVKLCRYWNAEMVKNLDPIRDHPRFKKANKQNKQ